MQRPITPQKSHGRGGIKHGFWQAEVMKVTASANDPYKIFIKIDRLGVGVNDPVPADYVGSPPRVGDLLWATFVENNHDEYLIFNTQHQVSDDMSEGVVRFGGQTEQYGVTMRINPTEYVGSNRASIMLDNTIMGTDSSGIGTEGDWYVYDKKNDAYNLHHSGHSNVANGGLTVRATGTHTQGTAGTFERYIQFAPSYDWSGYERNGIFTNTQYNDFTFFGTFYQYGCHPLSNNHYSLGYNGARWSELYCSNGTINTSDENQKTDIGDCDLGLAFINALRPVKFKWIETEGRTGVRTHYGLLGQEVETVLGSAASDTAIWTNALIEARPEMAGDPERNVIAVPAVEEHYEQGLRYTELISPMIKAIQEINVQLEGNAFQSQSAVDYIADFDAKMLAKQPQADQDRADIADLKTRVAALEAS
jgi:hypothetical protein